jgi:hypothetical protein
MYQWLDHAPKGRNETGVGWRQPRRVRQALNEVVAVVAQQRDGRSHEQDADLAAVDADFLAVGQHRPLEPDDLLAVGKLITDARDHVARLDRRLGPAVRLHPIGGGPTNQPFLDAAVISPNLEGNHRVRVCPHELNHGPLHRHELGIAHRPRMVGGHWDGSGDQCKNNNCRNE